MRAFTDNAGRSWSVKLNVAAIKRVRDLAKVDLLDLAEGRVIERLVADPITLCDVLFAVCKPQADLAQVTDIEFGEAMAGDAIEHASKALVEELIQFFPNARERAALSRVIRTMDAAMDRARTLVEQRLESGEIERAMTAAISGPLSIDLPESSALTPTA